VALFAPKGQEIAVEKPTSVQVLKMFFEADGGRPLTVNEFKELSTAERRELAEMAAKALGIELAEPVAA